MTTPPSPTASRPCSPTPVRPCLRGSRSALRRAPDAVQFGTDPRRALVLDGLTPPLRRMVTALDGTRYAGEVIADAVARGVAPGPARAVLDDMAAAGLLGSPGVGPGCPGSVLVRGGGRLAVAMVGVLAGAGVDEVGFVAAGRVGASDTGTGLRAADIGRPVADAVARAVPGVSPGPCPHPDLVVLAGAATEPAVADELLRRGRAHLAVAVRDGIGHVGPLVLPGRGACLRCAELARTDADPAWPAVLAQLAGSPPAVEVADATATAALAAAQVLAALAALAPAALAAPTGLTALAPLAEPERPAPATLGGVLELDLGRGSLCRTAVPVHPACVCTAAPPGSASPSARRPVPDPARPMRSATVARVA